MKNNFLNLYLDIHIIQMLPPSNVNRGQMGEPKSAFVGGTLRARVSSASQKRPTRLDFVRHGYKIGIRTKTPAAEIQRRLMDAGIEEERALELAKMAVTESKIGSAKENAKSALVFLSEAQFEAVAKAMYDFEKDSAPEKQKLKTLKDSLKTAVKENPSIDQLLFGRMFADNAALNYDAAAQVMHGFSVNTMRYEYDYFSAVDDLSKIQNPEHAGAGHISSKLFTDPIFYRYANVNLSDTSELLKYDREHAAEDAVAFAESFIMTLPTGASNAYASGTMPSFVLLVLREDRPINLAPAFVEPVKSDNYIAEAIGKLETEKERISKCYGAPVLSVDSRNTSLKDMLTQVREEIMRRL